MLLNATDGTFFEVEKVAVNPFFLGERFELVARAILSYGILIPGL